MLKFKKGDEVWFTATEPLQCQCCHKTIDFIPVSSCGILVTTCDGKAYIDVVGCEDPVIRDIDECYKKYCDMNFQEDKPAPKLCPNCAKYIKEMCHVCIMEED